VQGSCFVPPSATVARVGPSISSCRMSGRQVRQPLLRWLALGESALGPRPAYAFILEDLLHMLSFSKEILE
jgi:hypothetical protein